MNFNPKRSVSAILSAVMLLGMASPPVQALNSTSPSDDTQLCSHHTEHTPECGGLDGDCSFVCLEHTPQILPELHEDITGDETLEQSEQTEQTKPSEKPEPSEQSDLIPLVPAQPVTPSEPAEIIPALPLTPAEPVEDVPEDEMDSVPEMDAPIMLMARAREEVYTSATSGNHVHSGDGTYNNPYNLFDDAVEHIMPGGTIIIKNKGFLNTLNETGSLPYIIDKNITIKSEYTDRPATLQVRSGGIVLGDDVTFENVNLNFENRAHDAIFANGHTLTLKNVLRSNGSREIDLFGGQLYDLTEQKPYAADKKGSSSKIIIEMKDPKLAPLSSLHLGNIYAGSMNGPFDGNVTISVSDSNQGKTKFIGEVYASGALETDPGNMLDIKEPAPPVANADTYPVSGTVTMNFDSLPLRFSETNKTMLIDGTTGTGGGKTSLSVSVPSLTGNLDLKNISDLIVNKGTIQPTKNSTDNFDSITIKKDAQVDFSKIPSVTTKALAGEGTLTLKKDGALTVTNSFDNSTLIFQTEGAWNDKSGMVAANHTYVTVPSGSTGTFGFAPHVSQSSWRLQKDTSGAQETWVTTGTVDPDTTTIEPLTKFEIASEHAYKTVNTSYMSSTAINPHGDPVEFPLLVQSESGLSINDMYDYPLNCEINGTKLVPDNDGFYIDNATNIIVTVAPPTVTSDDPSLVLAVSTISDAKFPIPDDGRPYEIVVSYPGASGELLQATAYLTITEDPPQPENPDPGASNSQVTVTPSEESATFGENITVDTTVVKASTFSTRKIEKDKAYLYVNGKLVDSNDNFTNPVDVSTESFQFNNIAVTPDNGFRAGSNQISVVYGGGDSTSLGQLNGSTGTATITVNKATPTINVSNHEAITKTYDGTNVDYTPNVSVTVDHIASKDISAPQVSVIYKKGEKGLTQPPILPGTYQTEIQVAEGTTYQAKSITGPAITIQKATPKVSISHTFTPNNKVILEAAVQGAENGILPTGTVTFSVGGTSKTPVNLTYGIAKLEIDKPSTGEHNIQAAYTPSTGSADSSDQIYNPASSELSKLNILDNHTPLTGITLDHQSLVLKRTDSPAKLTVHFEPQNATNQTITWTSSDQNVATVADGTVKPISAGTTTIEARSIEGGYIASCFVTVSETDVPVTSVKINVPNETLKVGEKSQLSAVIEPYNATNRNVTWTNTSNSNVVTLDSSTGEITAVNKGTATITATVDGKTAQCEIKVTDTIPVEAIKLNTKTLSLKEKQTVLLIANITPDNATNANVTWSSESPEYVDVDAVTGLVTAKKQTAMPITITATTTDGSNLDAKCEIIVTEAAGKDIPVKSITIIPTTLTLNIHEQKSLRATVSPDDATNQQVTWKSEQTNIATVNENTGEVTGVAQGTATIIATSVADSQKTASIIVTVKGDAVTPPPTPAPTIQLSPDSLSLKVNDTSQLTAIVTNGDSNDVEWSIENDSGVITLNGPTKQQTIRITAIKAGNATVKATYTDKKSGTTVSKTVNVEVIDTTAPAVQSVQINGGNFSLEKDKSKILTATVSPEGVDKSVTWESQEPTIASINQNTGEVKAIQVGRTTITATSVADPTKKHSITVTVINSIIPIQSVSINGDHFSLKPGDKSTVTATVLPAQAEQSVTWSSSAPSIVAVDSQTGAITALKPGQATITATSVTDASKKDSKIVTVAEVPITSLKINESILSLREGQSAQLTIKIAPDNATNSAVKWTSDNDSVLSVTQDGYITARNKGVATITVTSVAQPEMKDSRMISVTASSSSSGGSSGGGSSHKPSKPNNKPAKPATKPETKPQVPPVTPPPAAIPPSVKPQPPKPGVPVITTPPPVNPTINTNFDDIPQTHWASEPIQDVVSRGLFVGTEPNEFSPNESMSRGMLVTVLHRLAGEPAVQDVNQFTDVGRTYYTDAITWASQNNIVSGTSANTFSPSLMVTREELVVMLYRLANPVPDTSVNLTSFSDAAKVSSWASAPMQWAVKNEILKGSDGALLPQHKLTRAEAASLISRFTKKVLHA